MEDIRPNNKKCDFCGEEIAMTARRCPYCGSLVDNRPVEPQYTPGAGSGALGTSGNIFDNTDNKVYGGSVEQNTVNVDVIKPDTDHSEIQKPQDQSEYTPPVANVPGGIDADIGIKSPQQSNYNYNPKPATQNLFRPEPYAPHVNPMGNGTKVFLTTLSIFVPWLGQLFGIIVAIVYMNSGDKDRKSFGVSLLVASLSIFVIISIFGCLAAMTFAPSSGGY